jgi:hypothetical protein
VVQVNVALGPSSIAIVSPLENGPALATSNTRLWAQLKVTVPNGVGAANVWFEVVVAVYAPVGRVPTGLVTDIAAEALVVATLKAKTAKPPTRYERHFCDMCCS